jgi:hypothetical protein
MRSVIVPSLATNRLLKRAPILMLFSSFLYGCTGGLSCGSEGGCINNYDYPQSDLTNGVQQVDEAARMRMTQSGLDFLRDHLKDILMGALGTDPAYPDTIVITLEPTEIITGITLGEGEEEIYPTRLLIQGDDLVEDMTLRFVEAGEQIAAAGETVNIAQDGFLMEVVDVPVGIDARLFTDLMLAGAGCDLDGANDAYCPEGTSDCGIISGLSFAVVIYPDVGTGNDCAVQGTECLLISVDVVGVDFDPNGNFDSDAIEISVPPVCEPPGGSFPPDPPGDCSPECSDVVLFEAADLECQITCTAQELFVDLIAILVDFIEPLLQPFLDELFETAIREALADFDRQPVAISDRLNFAELAEGAISATSHELGFNIQPSGNAFDVNCPTGMDCALSKGMDFALKSGAEAAPEQPQTLSIPHPCVQTIQGADFINMYGGLEFELATAIEPLTGFYNDESYHFAASIAEPAMNQGLFGMYNTGALCIEVASETVYELTDGAFLLSAGTIDLLTEGKLRQFTESTAPAIISIAPNRPPVITLGEGTEEDGLLQIAWEEVDISFYVLVYDRFARVFSVRSDISLASSIFHIPEEGLLEISIVDGPNVGNFSEIYNELLVGVSFSEVLESLVGLAFDALLADGLNVDINIADIFTDALGVPLYLDFHGIETTPAADPEFLNLYISLTDTAPSEDRSPQATQSASVANPSGLYLDLPEEAETPRTVPRPSGQIRIQGHVVSDVHEVEYFARVDFGAWRGPITADASGQFTLADPKLRLIGKHSIALRARHKGLPQTLEAQATTVDVWVDPYRPQANLIAEDETLLAVGQDRGSQPGDLLWSWQKDDNEWSAFSNEQKKEWSELEDVRTVRVRAQDPAGHISFPAALDLKALAASPAHADRPWAQARSLKDVEAESGGCQQTTATTLWSFLVIGGVLRRKRKPN